MVNVCGCLCSVAGHYGVCQVTAKPGLRHITGDLTVTPTAEVCQECHQAVVDARLRLPTRVATSRVARG
jgi:hypothetical protein